MRKGFNYGYRRKKIDEYENVSVATDTIVLHEGLHKEET